MCDESRTDARPAEQDGPTVSVVVYVTREVVRECAVDVDLAEFAEWSNGQAMTLGSVQEFIQSDRDFDVQSLWDDGDVIATEPGGHVEVRKVPAPPG